MSSLVKIEGGEIRDGGGRTEDEWEGREKYKDKDGHKDEDKDKDKDNVQEEAGGRTGQKRMKMQRKKVRRRKERAGKGHRTWAARQR